MSGEYLLGLNAIEDSLGLCTAMMLVLFAVLRVLAYVSLRVLHAPPTG